MALLKQLKHGTKNLSNVEHMNQLLVLNHHGYSVAYFSSNPVRNTDFNDNMYFT